jgi:hypothetical protein
MVAEEAGDRIRFKLSLADQVGAAFHQNAIEVAYRMPLSAWKTHI